MAEARGALILAAVGVLAALGGLVEEVTVLTQLPLGVQVQQTLAVAVLDRRGVAVITTLVLEDLE